MAKEDWTGAVKSADRDEDFPVTARKHVNETVYGSPDGENRAAAAGAGLKNAAYINYGEALEAYEAREDIEDLATKQTRNAPADFDAASFMRALPNKSGGNGYAPDPNNAVQDDFFAGTSGSN